MFNIFTRIVPVASDRYNDRYYSKILAVCQDGLYSRSTEYFFARERYEACPSSGTIPSVTSVRQDCVVISVVKQIYLRKYCSLL